MLEEHFAKYRKNIIGENKKFDSPFGEQKIIYSDWTASGRIYGPVEDALSEKFYPMVGNTHTETNVTGSSMTIAYHKAMSIVKKHVNASPEDVMISSNSGMTGVINKFQRILGLKVYEKHRDLIKVSENERPIVFITHMEHHSNQTSWLETLADVEIISPDKNGYVDLNNFAELLEKYKNRKTKYAAVTSCSNVTGIITPYFEISEMIHKAGGNIFVDFACSAPYIDIDMHPANKDQYLDAIFFSPHKFLGGPGSAGVLIFNKDLYNNEIPDNPGGGTVDWTNPWGLHKYLDDIEMREDGGTPAFLQTIKTALCVKVKEEMGADNIKAREEEQIDLIWDRMKAIKGLHILADNFKDRLGVISFYIDKLHYNLGVRILNDRFGVQMRGGCSCAGTYGHYLLHVDQETSDSISSAVTHGDMSNKPGWIRMSIHPTMSNNELEFIIDALEQLAVNFEAWGNDYEYNLHTNEFRFKEGNFDSLQKAKVEEWFEGSMS